MKAVHTGSVCTSVLTRNSMATCKHVENLLGRITMQGGSLQLHAHVALEVCLLQASCGGAHQVCMCQKALESARLP